MRNPISTAVLRRDDARPHSLPSAAAQRIGALLLDGDDGPAVVARKGALATLACCGFFLLIARTDFHAANATGFLATPTIGASGSHEVPTEDPRMRLNSKFGAMAGAVALSIGGQAIAQDAVQWRVADGGNGHWYRLSMKPLSFEAARQQSAALGGHLVTYSSSAEQNHVWQQVSPVVSPQPFFIGAYQVPNSCEPGCGWRWVTDEPFSYTAWLPGAPNDNLVNGNEDAVCINADNRWNDLAGQLPIPYVTEWDADCNNDGLVDYGQILAGELVDANGNNIPDCCEGGGNCPGAPVQWRVEDGGNGHWYRRVDHALAWQAAKLESEALGGHLVTVTSSAEWQFLKSTLPVAECWAGASQAPSNPGYAEPAGGWVWVTGEPFVVEPYVSLDDCPAGPPAGCNCGSGAQDALMFIGCCANVLDDIQDGSPDDCTYYPGDEPDAYIIEWSSDCNNDGIVDFGQLLDGTLVDANHNHTPDECECTGDFNHDGYVSSSDLSLLLISWGGATPSIADINGDGEVNAADMTLLLAQWGVCTQ